MRKWSEVPKLEKRNMITHVFAILLGSALLALGNAIFLINLKIITGGLSGIGIIIQYYVSLSYPDVQVIDIIVFSLTWILWVFGLIFGGKAFALRTLLASIFYPIFLSLFLRIPAIINLQDQIVSWAGPEDAGILLLCGIFGGLFVGSGVALNFLGNGSSGGVDVIIHLLEKYANLKSSIGSFIIDGSIIVLGIFLIPNNIIPSLCGIISAFVTAVSIEFIYNRNLTSYQVDIISDKWQEISKYAQDVLGRGATFFYAKGGYKGEERVILRIVFKKSQYRQLRNFISIIDPKAFITFTETNAVYGEGFKIINKTDSLAINKDKEKEDEQQ